MSCENNDLIERLLECEKELETRKDDLDTWTDALEELSEIEDAFATDGEKNLDNKTILDIGTDCVKPLYIALKFKPEKIIGINEELSISFASDLELKSKLFTETKIRLYNCSFFDDETLDKIRKEEQIKRFDFILVSKTLHHLRTGECIANKRDKNHKHNEKEECCVYEFKPQTLFENLLRLGERLIIYEFFDPSDTDNDKIRGRGGYFTREEWKEIFKYLSDEKYKVKFIRPQQFHLDKETINRADSILRQVDCICFYVEEQRLTNAEKL